LNVNATGVFADKNAAAGKTVTLTSGGTFNVGNYSISYVDGALGVTRAPLGIAANSSTRLYGDANPAFSATYTSFQNGENVAALSWL